MKLSFHSRFAVVVLLALMSFQSCKKTVPPLIINSSTPLYALLIGDTSLSLFNSMVQKAGDSVLYHGTDSIAVLMPVNAALIAQGITSSAISMMPAKSLDSFVRSYYVPGGLSLDTNAYALNKSLAGSSMYVYTDSSGDYYFNGYTGLIQKLPGSRAVVFKLSSLLQMPISSLAQLFSADTSLSFFAAAVAHTSINLIPSSGWNTILAPDNNSFIAAGYGSIAAINATDVSALSAIINYHVIPGEFFSNQFSGVMALQTLQGSAVNVTIDSIHNVPQFTGGSNVSAASITKADMLAGSNTIVQKINGLLLP
jgi:hypothetical protein